MFGGGGTGFAQPDAPADWWDDFPLSPGSQRQPATQGRINGEIVEWKNRYGWILPEEPINHPQARMKGGKIYLGQEDVAEVISGVGAKVSFYVYCDGGGLGALLCVPHDSPAVDKPCVKKVKATPKPKPKPKAPTPGRSRVNEEPMTGKVKTWRGGFGFIIPNSKVDHPLFTGSVFLHKGDLLTPEEMDVGKSVSFYLYADPQGLGAEECSVVEGDAAPASPTSADTKVLATPGGSTLLKARPKGGGAAPADSTMASFAAPTAKAKAMMKASAKAPSVARADPDLASKMAGNPELAKRLSAWMFDPGG